MPMASALTFASAFTLTMQFLIFISVGRNFYRATEAANGSEIVKSLGGWPRLLISGGCGGPQSLAVLPGAREM
jgi:hypothetical protein